jgi:hypothetical protein
MLRNPDSKISAFVPERRFETRDFCITAITRKDLRPNGRSVANCRDEMMIRFARTPWSRTILGIALRPEPPRTASGGANRLLIHPRDQKRETATVTKNLRARVGTPGLNAHQGHVRAGAVATRGPRTSQGKPSHHSDRAAVAIPARLRGIRCWNSRVVRRAERRSTETLIAPKGTDDASGRPDLCQKRRDGVRKSLKNRPPP